MSEKENSEIEIEKQRLIDWAQALTYEPDFIFYNKATEIFDGIVKAVKDGLVTWEELDTDEEKLRKALDKTIIDKPYFTN